MLRTLFAFLLIIPIVFAFDPVYENRTEEPQINITDVQIEIPPSNRTGIVEEWNRLSLFEKSFSIAFIVLTFLFIIFITWFMQQNVKKNRD